MPATPKPAVAKVAAPAAPVAPAAPKPIAPKPVAPVTKAPTPKPTRSASGLVLQGISYSPTLASAIVNGKTVRRGEPVGEYIVKDISPFLVTLVDSDQQEIKLSLSH
jgi:hypothetical protein